MIAEIGFIFLALVFFCKYWFSFCCNTKYKTIFLGEETSWENKRGQGGGKTLIENGPKSIILAKDVP